MRISDWSSDVCSSDLVGFQNQAVFATERHIAHTGEGFDGCALGGGATVAELAVTVVAHGPQLMVGREQHAVRAACGDFFDGHGDGSPFLWCACVGSAQNGTDRKIPRLNSSH